MTQPVLIAPFKTGIDTDVSPWLAPIDSFGELNNFHVHHGFIEKRGGFRLFGYMVHNPATTITAITLANPGVVTAAGHGITNGQQLLITNVGGMTEVNNRIFTAANVGVNTIELSGEDTSGFTAYTAGGRVALFDANRIMGLHRYYASDGTKTLLAFDTERAALYNTTSDRFDPLDAADIMSGSTTDYVWSENWQSTGGTNRLYFSNGKAYDGASLDGIRYYDPSVSTTATTGFQPSVGGTRTLYGAKLIFSIKQRLVVLNTFEFDSATATTSNFPQRARWCQAQGPSNWNDTTAGGGGFVDAPTGEQIISARPLQDVIIVYFTNSVWTLRPVPDPALPFRWDKINDFRACDGKMATSQYDRYIVAFGVRGITATDGVETRRIDDRIHDFTSDEVDTANFQKVFCARDYNNQRFWSLFPTSGSSESTKALIYDDESAAFSEYDIAMNVLGWANQGYDYRISDFTAENGLDFKLSDMNEESLQSYFWQDDSEVFVGGTIGGVIHTLQTTGTDDGSDISCDLTTNAWNPFQGEGKECQLNYVDLLVETESTTQLTVEFYKDSDTSPYVTRQSDILPPLDYVASIANITQANPAGVEVTNHGLTTADIIFIYGVQGMTEVNGQFTITVVDSNNITLDGIDATAFTAYISSGQIVRKEFYRTISWKRIVAGGIGFQHRMRILNSGSNQPLKFEAFKPYFKPRGRRTIN